MGVYAQGLGESLLLGIESSFKTMPGTPKAAKIPIISPAIKLDVTRFRSEALTGTPEPRAPVDGKHKVGGQYELECSPDSLMLPLYGLMGAVTENGVAGIYEHVFTLADTPYMFAQEGHTDLTTPQYLLWNGLRHGSSAMRFEPEGLMKATFTVMGAKQTDGLTASQVTGGNTRDDTGGAPFDYTTCSIKQGGSTILYLQSIGVDVDRGAENVMAIDGTTELADIILKIASVKGTIKSLFKDAVLLQQATNSTELSLEIMMPSGTVGYGLRVLMPTVKLMPSSPTTAGAGLVTVDYNYDAYARGTASDIAGQVGSFGFTSVTIVGGSDTLDIKINGGATQSFTLTAGATAPASVVSQLSALTGGAAVVENNRVVIRTTTKGTLGSVQVLSSSTADTILGFHNTVNAGFSAKSVVFYLTNSVATVAPA